MIYALNEANIKIKPSPGTVGYCQLCQQELIAKCGEINSWHWAHKSLSEQCDGYEETEWHRYWKRKFKPENTEVRFERAGIVKIADIVTDGGMVIELQHSPITPDEIRLREMFYGNMKWIFDCRDAFKWGRIVTYPDFNRGGWTVHWKQSKKIITYCASPVILATYNQFLALFDRLHATEFVYDFNFYSFEDFLKDHA